MTENIADPRIVELTKQLSEGQISRRQFMEGSVAMGLTLTAASGLMNKAAAATPKRGGHFRVAEDDGNTTDTLDPALYLSQFEIAVSHTHRNYLTEITPDNVVGPELAKSYEASDDAATWYLKLQEGVEFHDGKPFTSEDVVASLNHHRGDDTKSAAKSLLASVEDIKADGKYSVTVKLNAGSADFPYVLTDYHLTMLPSDGEGGVRWRDGEGTGGYVLEHFDPGVRADFKRFPNYWKEGRAHFDSIELLVVIDVTARQAGLRTGDFDAMIEVDLKTAHLLDNVSNIEVIEVPSGTHTTFPMHSDVAPFDNNDVRLALKYAIDREQSLQKILYGHGTIGNDHPISPVLPFHAAGLEQRVYDPERAKHHLKKAGLDSLKVDFSTSNVPLPNGVDLAVLYQHTAKAAGIEINVIREPADGYWSNVWLVKPFSLAGWGQRPTPDVIFSLAYAEGVAWNASHFSHDRFNRLLVEARAELDNTKRSELYYEMQEIMRDEGGVIIPMFRNFVYAHLSNVMHDEQLSGNWSLDGNRGTERWWFA